MKQNLIQDLTRREGGISFKGNRFQSLKFILSEVFLLPVLTSSKAYVQEVLPGSPVYRIKGEEHCCLVPTVSLWFLLIDKDVGLGSVFYTL